MFVHKGTVEAQRVPGQQKTDSCLCKINSSTWTFPAVQFIDVTRQVQICEDNLNEFEEKVSFLRQLELNGHCIDFQMMFITTEKNIS